jgi:hypothetical protein
VLDFISVIPGNRLHAQKIEEQMIYGTWMTSDSSARTSLSLFSNHVFEMRLTNSGKAQAEQKGFFSTSYERKLNRLELDVIAGPDQTWKARYYFRLGSPDTLILVPPDPFYPDKWYEHPATRMILIRQPAGAKQKLP